MTLESINIHIDGLCEPGRLVLFDPNRLPHEGYRRRLWLHPEVAAWIDRLGETKAEKRYLANVRALLKRFVIGDDFDDDELLWRLDTPRAVVWEIRVVFDPHWRLFGCFLRPGELIITHHKARQLLEHEGFKKHIQRCEALMAAMFPGFTVMAGVARSELLREFSDHHET